MYKNILLAVDLGEDASWKKALPEAVSLTKASGGILHIMTVVPDFGMTIVGSFFPSGFEAKAIEEAKDQLHAFVSKNVPSDVRVQHIIAHGSPAHEILAAAKKVPTDVIVIGSHRPGLEHAVLGSVATRVVSHAACSVLVVRG
ncbi:MAG: universal stress protein [Alphaproteobacteria bacterium]|nr:universal stress protein [Alphaproteobacteria bacterium]